MVPEMTCAFIVSYAVLLVVSAVSIRTQKVKVAVVAEAGIVTDWDAFSLTVRPLPPSHSFQLSNS
ncbi:hypothetical protein GCM10028781_16400 [Nostocoides australiense]